ncbi:hypothetical protein LY78DRAFT_58808 [Colletotrichum sublineola]|nr:hypothetical protein LY78DRAFT_58808 [Colletotrichum sublineola]
MMMVPFQMLPTACQQQSPRLSLSRLGQAQNILRQPFDGAEMPCECDFWGHPPIWVGSADVPSLCHPANLFPIITCRMLIIDDSRGLSSIPSQGGAALLALTSWESSAPVPCRSLATPRDSIEPSGAITAASTTLFRQPNWHGNHRWPRPDLCFESKPACYGHDEH